MNKKFDVLSMLLILMLSGCGTKSLSSTPATSSTPKADPIISSPAPTKRQNSQEILLADLSGKYYFEDLYTGHIEQWNPQHFVYKVLGWGSSKCSIIAQLESSIAEVDLEGNVLETIFSFENLPKQNDEGKMSIPVLSPNKEFIYYKVGYGEPLIFPDLTLSRFEKEYIELMPVDDASTSLRISKNGGAWLAAWSPDSMHIAFSDYDSNGISQIFVSTFDGKDVKQISFFDSQIEFLNILWSPNSKYVVATYDVDSDWAGDATLFAEIDNGRNMLLENLTAWWWRDETSIIGGAIGNGLVVLDIFENSNLDSYGEIDYRGFLVGQFKSPYIVGYFNQDGIFTYYDTKTMKVDTFPNSTKYSDYLSYWLTVPGNITDCR